MECRTAGEFRRSDDSQVSRSEAHQKEDCRLLNAAVPQNAIGRLSEWAPIDQDGYADEYPSDKVYAADQSQRELEPLLEWDMGKGADSHYRSDSRIHDVGDAISDLEDVVKRKISSMAAPDIAGPADVPEGIPWCSWLLRRPER